MFSNVALDVVIGLIFIFLLYSLLATILAEIIATIFAFRAKNLETAISRMLNDDHNGPDTFKARLKSWGGSFFRHLKRMFWAKPEATAKEFYNHVGRN